MAVVGADLHIGVAGGSRGLPLVTPANGHGDLGLLSGLIPAMVARVTSGIWDLAHIS
jgi:hypothetical protein